MSPEPPSDRYSVEPTELAGLTGWLLRDARAGVEATILDRGAELITLRRRDARTGRWVSHLAREGQVNPASVWQPLHCPHLGFYAHTLVGDRSAYGGGWVRGPGHGLLPDHAYRPDRISTRTRPAGASAVYRIEPGDYPREAYPRALALAITQTLVDGWLEIAYQIDNREAARPVHLSFGAHPAFPIAEPERFEVRLAPGRYRQWLIDDAVHLTGEAKGITVGPEFRFPWAFASLRSPVMLEMVDVPSPGCVGLDPATGLGVEFDLADRPYLTFWSNAPDFVCIEPIWGLPDAAKQTVFDRKPGILEVPVGGSLTRRFRLRPFGVG